VCRCGWCGGRGRGPHRARGRDQRAVAGLPWFSRAPAERAGGAGQCRAVCGLPVVVSGSSWSPAGVACAAEAVWSLLGAALGVPAAVPVCCPGLWSLVQCCLGLSAVVGVRGLSSRAAVSPGRTHPSLSPGAGGPARPPARRRSSACARLASYRSSRRRGRACCWPGRRGRSASVVVVGQNTRRPAFAGRAACVF
jgi:hypothetical protein